MKLGIGDVVYVSPAECKGVFKRLKSENYDGVAETVKGKLRIKITTTPDCSLMIGDVIECKDDLDAEIVAGQLRVIGYRGERIVRPQGLRVRIADVILTGREVSYAEGFDFSAGI